jgi:hypothetical protein
MAPDFESHIDFHFHKDDVSSVGDDIDTTIREALKKKEQVETTNSDREDDEQ